MASRTKSEELEGEEGYVGQGAGGWFKSQKDILYYYFSLTRLWCSKVMCQTAEVIN